MIYITKTGDTFDSIAKNIMGDRKYTEQLMEVNKEYITTVVFSADVELIIPKINEKADITNNNLPPWRSD